MIDFKKLVAETLVENSNNYTKDDSLFEFHPSQICQCERQIFFSKIKASHFSVEILGKMQVGTCLHIFFERLQEIKDRCDIETPFALQFPEFGFVIKGKSDCKEKDNSALYDFKGIASFSYILRQPMEHNVEQVNVYLKAFNISKGVIVYVHKLDLSILPHEINFNQELFNHTIEKLKKVYPALKDWELTGDPRNPFPKCGCWNCGSENLKPEYLELVRQFELKQDWK